MYGERLHYVPHTYTGIAVSLLFLGRLVFRGVQAYTAAPSPHADASQLHAPAAMLRSPLTAGIFFVLVGYYVCYYSLVLWKSKRLKPEDIESAPASAAPAP
jgi:cytochrome b561